MLYAPPHMYQQQYYPPQVLHPILPPMPQQVAAQQHIPGDFHRDEHDHWQSSRERRPVYSRRDEERRRLEDDTRSDLRAPEPRESPDNPQRIDRDWQSRSASRRVASASSRDDAPLHQQIKWGKRLTSRDATVESILTLFSTDGHRFEPRTLATAAHRAAKNGKRDRRSLQQDPRILALGDACVRRVNDFYPQHLANVVWAFATLGVKAPQLFTEVADVAVSKLRDFNSQAIANTAWAFLTAGVEAPRLFAEMAGVAVSKLSDFSSQAIANMAWAFATSAVKAPRLAAEIADVAMSKLRDFTPQNIANTAWAFATAGVEAPRLFADIGDVVVSKLRNFNSQHIANTVWAFATAGVEAPRLFAEIAQAAVSKLRDFNSQDIANTAWAFATAGVEVTRLFAEIAQVAVSKLRDFSSQNIANTVWAFATAGIEAPRLFAEIADVAVSKLRDFNSQAIANMAWAFACIGFIDLDVFTTLLTEVMAKRDHLGGFDLSQLHLVDLHYQCAFPDQHCTLAPIRDRLQAAYKRNEPKPSQWQRDVAAVLKNLEWAHEFEYTTPEGLSLDMAQPNSKCAVEVDGPSHYLKGGPVGTEPRENGRTRFKSRLLRELGWTVVRVPCFEWRALSPGSTENYLRSKLAVCSSDVQLKV